MKFIPHQTVDVKLFAKNFIQKLDRQEAEIDELKKRIEFLSDGLVALTKDTSWAWKKIETMEALNRSVMKFVPTKSGIWLNVDKIYCLAVREMPNGDNYEVLAISTTPMEDWILADGLDEQETQIFLAKFLEKHNLT